MLTKQIEYKGESLDLVCREGVWFQYSQPHKGFRKLQRNSNKGKYVYAQAWGKPQER